MSKKTSSDEIKNLRSQIAHLEKIVGDLKIEHARLERVVFEDRENQESLKQRIEVKNREFAEIFEGSHDALSFHDIEDGTILLANTKLSELTGYDTRVLNGGSIELISHTESGIFTKELVRETNLRVLKDGPKRLEWQGKDKHNNTFWLDIVVKPSYFNDRQAILAAARDISDFVQAQKRLYEIEEELNRKEESETLCRRLLLLTDGLPHVVWIADAHGRIIFWNHRFFEVSGVPLSIALTDQWQKLIHPEDVHGYRREWMNCVATGASFDYEFRMRKLSGSNKPLFGMYRWYKARAVARYDSSGEIAEWYGTLSDIEKRN